MIPWFGRELKGGAEQQAWQIATRLAARGHAVEVLTTCCRSFFDDWSENHLPAGTTREAGLTIRRFPVDARDVASFDDLNRELLAIPRARLLPGVSPVDHERAAIWTRQNINSSALESYLKRYNGNYHAFVFLPYLYGVILRGLPLVADKAWLQPCLHDEAYAYLPDVAEIFYQARGLLFISAGEMQLAARLYGPMIFAKGAVAGAGIELETLTADHSESLPPLLGNRRFMLCLGRRDSGKGTDQLVAAFRRFRQSRPSSDLGLVLAGPGDGNYSDRAQDVTDLGLVSEGQKAALVQACVALCQPSGNESFSRVLFEAWACGKPAVVQRDCLATAVAVQASDGGWLAGSQDEWVQRIADIDSSDAATLAGMGTKGHSYAREMADWDRIMARYEAILGRCANAKARTPPKKKAMAIHQLLPNLAYGDAISNEAMQIRDWLRAQEYRSEIFVRYVDSRVSDQCRLYESGAIRAHDGLIYHHSIGSEITAAAVLHSGPKCLIYHNITPPEFFRPYRPEFAHLLRHGREEMWTLAHAFRCSAGDSLFNAEELAFYGFPSPGVLHLAIDPGKWCVPPDADLMQRLRDGKRNLLFVGRYAPNKCQHHLVEAFAHYLAIDSAARLILIGNGDPHDPYVRHLERVIDHCGVRGHVMMPGHISDAQLHAYYRTADLFWSMSEHEGFCVPLIEAMWFDVPVLAFHSSAVPETLADTGLMFKDKSELSIAAGLALKSATDPVTRDSHLAIQRERRRNFLPESVFPQFARIVHSLEEQARS